MQHVQGVHDTAAVDARVQVATRAADRDVQPHHPAQRDGDRGRRVVGHAGVEHDRAVGAATIVAQPAGDAGAADFLLPLDEHAYVDR